MPNDDSAQSDRNASMRQRVKKKNEADVHLAGETLVSDKAREQELEQRITEKRLDIERLPQTELGWHQWLVWPVLAIGAAMEWNIAWLAAQTLFGADYWVLVAFAVAISVCGVAIGWFIGRVLRKQREAGAEPSRLLRGYLVVSIIVVVVLLGGAFALRYQAASMGSELKDPLTLIGQSLLTTVLSALGILVASGVEFFRQGDQDIALRKELKKLERERAELDAHIEREKAQARRSVHAYESAAAELGFDVDRALIDAVCPPLTTSSDKKSAVGNAASGGQGASDSTPAEAKPRKLEVVPDPDVLDPQKAGGAAS
jgi:hypothetical protein